MDSDRCENLKVMNISFQRQQQHCTLICIGKNNSAKVFDSRRLRNETVGCLGDLYES